MSTSYTLEAFLIITRAKAGDITYFIMRLRAAFFDLRLYLEIMKGNLAVGHRANAKQTSLRVTAIV